MNVYSDGETPAFSCWRRCPQADVEGTPCGIAVLKKDVSSSNYTFQFCVLTHSGTCYRCPLHIRRLRAAPSPAGEGFFGFPPGGIRSTSCSVSLCFGRLVAAPTIHTMFTYAIVVIFSFSLFTNPYFCCKIKQSTIDKGGKWNELPEMRG